MTRAYLRLDPGFFERKVIRQAYPPAAALALIGTYCLAESQPERGRFRDERLLRAMLGPLGPQVTYLMKHGDLVKLDDGRVYPDGWDEWQEGDWKVGERVKRIRDRTRVTPDSVTEGTSTTVTNDTPATVTSGTVPTVYTPSERGIAGHSGAGISKERDSSRAERADIQALLDRGWKRVTPKQRAILDEVLDRHDVTGPAWAAGIIAGTPPDSDPLEAVKQADGSWQSEQRTAADQADAAWQATKEADRNGAAETYAELEAFLR